MLQRNRTSEGPNLDDDEEEEEVKTADICINTVSEITGEGVTGSSWATAISTFDISASTDREY